MYPGWLGRLLTTRSQGLENHARCCGHLRDDKDAIKVCVEVDGR